MHVINLRYFSLSLPPYTVLKHHDSAKKKISTHGRLNAFSLILKRSSDSGRMADVYTGDGDVIYIFEHF